MRLAPPRQRVVWPPWRRCRGRSFEGSGYPSGSEGTSLRQGYGKQARGRFIIPPHPSPLPPSGGRGNRMVEVELVGDQPGLRQGYGWARLRLCYAGQAGEHCRGWSLDSSWFPGRAWEPGGGGGYFIKERTSFSRSPVAIQRTPIPFAFAGKFAPLPESKLMVYAAVRGIRVPAF